MTRLFRRLILGILTLGLIFGLVGSALADDPELAKSSTLEKILKDGKIRVGLNAGYVPFEMLDKDGNFIGFDIELAQYMAERLGVKLEIVNVDWDGIIPALVTDKFDLIMSGMTRTLERAKAVNFSKPYFITGQSLLLNKERSADVESYEDLNVKGKVISVMLGTTGDLAATKFLPNAEIKRFTTEAEAGAEVAFGRADAMVYDQPFVAIYSKEHSDTTFAILEPFTYESFGFAIRKGDPDFLRWLDLFIDEVKVDGTYDRLFQKYFIDMPWLEIVPKE
jgi:polar amino acid transport system substrate-binding protein